MIDSHRDEIAKLESLYAMNPEGRVFTHLAEACRKAGQLERARQILEEGLQKHPDYASAHVVLGRVLSDSGENEPAVAEFRRVLELDRHNLVALRSLGELATRAGHTEEALHYYGELAVLDPTDAGIQEQMRQLREGGAEGSATAGEPAEAGTAAAAGDTGEEPSDEPESLEIERHGPGPVSEDEEYERVAGLESTSGEPEPEEARPVEVEGSLPAWPEAGEAEPELPGEAPPVDEAAWREIAASGAVTEEEAAAIGDVEDSPAGTGEPAAEDRRFAPPGMFEGPAARHDDEEGEAAAQADGPGGATAPEVEGRWEPPASMPADEAAERSRGKDESGEWIPADRWEWVAASADPSAIAGRPADGVEDEASGSTAPDRGPEVDEETSFAELTLEESGYDDEETSFAGLADDDATVAYADDETSFAGLTDDEETSAHEAETSFAGLAEDEAPLPDRPEPVVEAPDAEPVDSFEEGAAAVLHAFARGGEGREAEEVEGDDAAPEIPAEPAGSGGDAPRAPEQDDDGPVWITDADDESDQVITETLAEIYASQGLYDRAAAVYRRLIGRHPEDDRLQARLTDLEAAAGWVGEEVAGGADEERDAFLERVESAWTGGEGAAGMGDSPYAWTERSSDTGEDGPRVGDYFASLLAWRPSGAVLSDSAAQGSAEPGGTEDWYAEESEREPEAGDAAEPGREGEEDLEMFRSWLKSLKK